MEVPSDNQDTITCNSVSGISNNKGDKLMGKELTGDEYRYRISVKVETKDTDITIKDAIATLDLSQIDYYGFMDKLDEFVVNKSWDEGDS